VVPTAQPALILVFSFAAATMINVDDKALTALKDVTLIVVGFYFGAAKAAEQQKEKDKKRDEQEATHTLRRTSDQGIRNAEFARRRCCDNRPLTHHSSLAQLLFCAPCPTRRPIVLSRRACDLSGCSRSV